MHIAILVSYHSEFQYKCYNLGGVRNDTLLQSSIKLRKKFKNQNSTLYVSKSCVARIKSSDLPVNTRK